MKATELMKIKAKEAQELARFENDLCEPCDNLYHTTYCIKFIGNNEVDNETVHKGIELVKYYTNLKGQPEVNLKSTSVYNCFVVKGDNEFMTKAMAIAAKVL